MIEPISDIQKTHVEAATTSYIKLSAGLYDRKFDPIPVHFDLKGKCAGMYEVKGRFQRIRYNPWLFAKYYEDQSIGSARQSGDQDGTAKTIYADSGTHSTRHRVPHAGQHWQTDIVWPR